MPEPVGFLLWQMATDGFLGATGMRGIAKAATEGGRDAIERVAHWRREKNGKVVWVHPHEVHLHKAIHGKQPSLPKDKPESIDLGRQAVQIVLASQQDFVHAMYRKDMGWIDFPWGVPGNGPPEFLGGFGFDHIMTKRDWEHHTSTSIGEGRPLADGFSTLRMLPDVIAKGTISDREGRKVTLEYKGWKVILVQVPKTGKNPESGWLLSGFEKNAKR